jgi:hypothetical protein
MTVEVQDRWLWRAGAVSALALAIGYVVIIGLYVPLGAPPGPAEERLAYIARNTTTWWAILWISAVTDLLFVPVGLALYAALKGMNRSAMALAAACVGLFVFLDLALTWSNYAALIVLSGKYASAVSESARQAVVTAAEYPAIVSESTYLFVCNTMTLSVGILIAGVVMKAARFGKGAAYTGIATGVLGIVAVVGPLLVPALGPTIIVASVLTMAWLFFVAYELWRLSTR